MNIESRTTNIEFSVWMRKISAGIRLSAYYNWLLSKAFLYCSMWYLKELNQKTGY